MRAREFRRDDRDQESRRDDQESRIDDTTTFKAGGNITTTRGAVFHQRMRFGGDEPMDLEAMARAAVEGGGSFQKVNGSDYPDGITITSTTKVRPDTPRGAAGPSPLSRVPPAEMHEQKRDIRMSMSGGDELFIKGSVFANGVFFGGN